MPARSGAFVSAREAPCALGFGSVFSLGAACRTSRRRSPAASSHRAPVRACRRTWWPSARTARKMLGAASRRFRTTRRGYFHARCFDLLLGDRACRMRPGLHQLRSRRLRRRRCRGEQQLGGSNGSNGDGDDQRWLGEQQQRSGNWLGEQHGQQFDGVIVVGKRRWNVPAAPEVRSEVWRGSLQPAVLQCGVQEQLQRSGRSWRNLPRRHDGAVLLRVQLAEPARFSAKLHKMRRLA